MRLLLAMLMVVGIAGPAWAEEAPMHIAGAKTVNAEQVIALVNETPGLVIIDSRKPEDFAGGAIEGAVPLTSTEMVPDALARLVADRRTPVLFYCNGVKCGRAADAVRKAIDWGYTQVYYYALGIAEWSERGLPLVAADQGAR